LNDKGSSSPSPVIFKDCDFFYQVAGQNQWAFGQLRFIWKMVIKYSTTFAELFISVVPLFFLQVSIYIIDKENLR